MSSTGPSGKSVGETLDDQRPIRNAQITGLETLDAEATLTFTLYKRMVLPADGFVFWVRADTLSPSAVLNRSALNTVTLNQGAVIVTPAPQFDAPGSLHHTTLNQQDEAESFSLQKMTFTTPVQVDELTEIAPDELWIADWLNLKFAFSSRTGYYVQAGTYHYRGDALYPSLATQVIDFPSQLPNDQIVSNSLPLWLTLNQLFPVYPSFLVPDNITPPYAAVHIGEDDTSALQPVAYHDANSSRWQLTKDRVKVTLYGVRNDMIMDWLDLVSEFTLMNDAMGLMSQTPPARDAKRGQTEMSILAQKKVVTFEVNYYQSRIRDIARQYITSVFLHLAVAPGEFQELGPFPAP
jgi:hypothetical protein